MANKGASVPLDPWSALAGGLGQGLGSGIGSAVGGAGGPSRAENSSSFSSPWVSSWSVATGGGRAGPASTTSNDVLGSAGQALNSPWVAVAVVGVLAAVLYMRKR